MSDTELLKELLACFFLTYEGHLEWKFNDGETLNDILGECLEKQLLVIAGYRDKV